MSLRLFRWLGILTVAPLSYERRYDADMLHHLSPAFDVDPRFRWLRRLSAPQPGFHV